MLLLELFTAKTGCSAWGKDLEKICDSTFQAGVLNKAEFKRFRAGHHVRSVAMNVEVAGTQRPIIYVSSICGWLL